MGYGREATPLLRPAPRQRVKQPATSRASDTRATRPALRLRRTPDTPAVRRATARLSAHQFRGRIRQLGPPPWSLPPARQLNVGANRGGNQKEKVDDAHLSSACGDMTRITVVGRSMSSPNKRSFG